MERFQILSLDGGGTRGMFSAAVLAHIQEDLSTPITDFFDLIVGTSTGGLIAIALGLGFSPKEIVEFYANESESIFGKKIRSGILQRTTSPKYPAVPLECALKKYFKDKKLGDSVKRLVIPSFNLDEMQVQLFKTAHNARLKRDYKIPAWQIARATSAAPTFFPAYHSENHEALIDGGVWANNPVMVGITEAISLLDVPLSSIRVFSLGTIDEIPSKKKEHLYDGGWWTWKKEVHKVLMAGQAIGANNQAMLLLNKERLLRFSPTVTEGMFELDSVDPAAFLAKAAHHSKPVVPEFEAMFASHVAPVFSPIYKLEDQQCA